MATVYAEHAPPRALAHLVACGWTLTSDEALPGHRVLPDGCMDIVVGAGRDAVIAGPWTQAFLAPLAPGAFAAGIRFRPGAGPALLGLGAAELRDRHAPLAEAWGPGAAEGAGDASDAEHALAILAAALRRRLPDAPPPDPAVLAAAATLARRPGTPLAQLVERAGLGERQLRRRFTDHVGYGPKRLARVLRLQRLLSTPADEAWAARALSAGYADQAHMTRECVALTGLPPTRLS